jgi:hypothetical protein
MVKRPCGRGSAGGEDRLAADLTGLSFVAHIGVGDRELGLAEPEVPPHRHGPTIKGMGKCRQRPLRLAQFRPARCGLHVDVRKIAVRGMVISACVGAIDLGVGAIDGAFTLVGITA